MLERLWWWKAEGGQVGEDLARVGAATKSIRKRHIGDVGLVARVRESCSKEGEGRYGGIAVGP